MELTRHIVSVICAASILPACVPSMAQLRGESRGMASSSGPSAGDQSVESPVAAYTFVVDGKSQDLPILSLNGTPEYAQPGDVAWHDEVPFVLGSPGLYRLETTPEEDGHVFRVLADGTKEIIGLNVYWPPLDAEPQTQSEVCDALTSLLPKNLQGVRGVQFNGWPQNIVMFLDKFDLSKTVIILNGEEKSLPNLPPSIRYLIVNEGPNEGIEDYSALTRLQDLLFFVWQDTNGELDTGFLRQNRNLRYLDLESATSGFAELASLVELRDLTLTSSTQLHDLGFIKAMTKLRLLDVEASAVTDLSPVAKLPALKILNVRSTDITDLSPLGGMLTLTDIWASGSRVDTLPTSPIPSLTNLEVMLTPLNNELVARFRANHPNCIVEHRWNDVLKQRAKNATRVLVRTGCPAEDSDAKKETILDERDPVAIRELINGIDIDEENSRYHCMCCGDATIEFYRNDEPLIVVSLHHCRSLRGLWPSDAMLTEQSAAFLMGWIRARDSQAQQAVSEYQAFVAKHASLTTMFDGDAAPSPTPDDLKRLAVAAIDAHKEFKKKREDLATLIDYNLQQELKDGYRNLAVDLYGKHVALGTTWRTPFLHYFKAQLHLDADDYETALHHYRQAVEGLSKIDHKNKHIEQSLRYAHEDIVLCGKKLLTVGPQPGSEIEPLPLIPAATDLLRDCQQLLELFPDSSSKADCRLIRVRILMEHGHYPEARTELNHDGHMGPSEKKLLEEIERRTKARQHRAAFSSLLSRSVVEGAAMGVEEKATIAAMVSGCYELELPNGPAPPGLTRYLELTSKLLRESLANRGLDEEQMATVSSFAPPDAFAVKPHSASPDVFRWAYWIPMRQDMLEVVPLSFGVGGIRMQLRIVGENLEGHVEAFSDVPSDNSQPIPVKLVRTLCEY